MQKSKDPLDTKHICQLAQQVGCEPSADRPLRTGRPDGSGRPIAVRYGRSSHPWGRQPRSSFRKVTSLVAHCHCATGPVSHAVLLPFQRFALRTRSSTASKSLSKTISLSSTSRDIAKRSLSQTSYKRKY